MDKKDIKAIAEIIKQKLISLEKQRMTIPNQPRNIIIGLAHHEDAIKELTKSFADYFEKAEGYQCGSCEHTFKRLNKNCCPKCSSGNWVKGFLDDNEEDLFNREQFLKEVGVE